MKSVRLPQHIKPERYQLTIKPNVDDFVFEGSETIFIKLTKATKYITLHSKDLKIENVEYITARKAVIKGKVTYDIKNETATFSFAQKLPIGYGELELHFKGILNDKMRGFYRSRYLFEGKEKHMATTQFEATDARMAFPCFDEPAHKAIFDVTLQIPNDLTAISNTIETEVKEHIGGYKVVKFAPTPKMSTYLLAFIVGDFEFIEANTKNGVLVRVFVTPGKKHQAKFALDTSIKILEFYNKYFDIPYPLPVLDLIAIPDFSHGAMENWGAITYRESALLVDPEHSSASNKQWVALVIAHELAHQWFGNLVTMEWWTHLWLNEGFASYIEYLAVNEIFPSWDIWTQFAFADLGVALKLDALKHTHPIEVEVNHPNEIGEIFDEVSYSKGASVIRMLAGYLGEKNFRDGLRYYLKKHSYQNASTINLWEAFEKISKKPVRKLMQNWTAKPGYPVIKITEKNNQLVLEQSRFLSSKISKNEIQDKVSWQIPFDYKTKSGKSKADLITAKYKTLPKPKNTWVKFNSEETGFYRVDYPAQMLAELHKPIQNKTLPALDRFGLVRDAFALAEAGEFPTTQALNLIQAYNNETDYTVWVELVSGISSVNSLIRKEEYYPEFEKYCRGVFQKIGQHIGWKAKPKEGHLTSLLRSLILHQLVNFKDPKAINHALKIGSDTEKIPADIRSVVYFAIAQNGKLKEHNKFIELYKSSTLNEEQNRLGRALGQFSDPKLLKKSLEFAFSKNVRIQDTAQIFLSVWLNPQGSRVAWDFTKKNWAELVKRYPASGHIINRFIKPASIFTTKDELADYVNFFKLHKAPGAERTIAQVKEKISSNIEWLQRDGNHLLKFFSNK